MKNGHTRFISVCHYTCIKFLLISKLYCFSLLNVLITCRSISEKFNIGKGTALRAVRRVSTAIAKLSPLFMTWPKGDNAEKCIKEFFICSAFPNVIGAIDGTHINIKAPHVNPESYVNRKGYHSIQLQVTY